ncbi:hypothetical protein KIK84_09375 [Curvibacter sp. CHRR-16]|uniref:DUF6172 family protein n=1 Tax=Curvibacter sp. CHRR-16 TaxID=2835872 RepID=UPI001BD952EE|nr:DUF6172 family protein [Curvibacter sp. CHRR-16]MBT0570540.1 hypothetical protein [Curvibacter sp. CHRR-16]
MKKTYQLQIEGKNRDRLLDAARHDIRKYQHRELRRPLPEGFDVWEFDCRFGPEEALAEAVSVRELPALITTITDGGANQFYVELRARAGKRSDRPRTERPRAADEAGNFLDEDGDD